MVVVDNILDNLVFVLDEAINCSLLDHDELGEVITIVEHVVHWEVQSRVDVGKEIILKFKTCFKFGVFEHVVIVTDEGSKESVDKSVSDSGFQLNEKVVAFDLIVIKKVAHLSIVFNRIQQLLGDSPVPSFLKL